MLGRCRVPPENECLTGTLVTCPFSNTPLLESYEMQQRRYNRGMSFTVKLSDGSSVDFLDSATYTFEPHGVLAVRARRDGQRYEHTTRRFAPLRWTEVVASDLHEPGRYRDRDKWLGGGGGSTTLLAYREQDDPEFVPDGAPAPSAQV